MGDKILDKKAKTQDPSKDLKNEATKTARDKVVILDFGSQYTHLIRRKIRELSVNAEIVKFGISAEEIMKMNPKAIIFSGGPSSVYEANSPKPENRIFEMNVPILGICYGHQLIVDHFGGKVNPGKKEYGPEEIEFDSKSKLFVGISEHKVWMSHGDAASTLPDNFSIIAHTKGSFATAIENRDKKIYGLQFHPEVVHTPQGTAILKNFVVGIAGARQELNIDKFIESKIAELSAIEGRVIFGVSGGVDSTVAATLLSRAIGDKVTCVFVDNGLLREGEAEDVVDLFKNRLGVKNFVKIDASERFISALKGVGEPEQKRKIVGKVFADVFIDFARSKGPFEYLGQGTLYPDVIESGVSGGPAAVIKTHHNVGGLPADLGLKVIEPLRDLYKDEARRVGRSLGIPENITNRHPFPGPSLAVRIVGEVTEEKLKISRHASKIVEEELRIAGLYDSVWQAFAVVDDTVVTGVVGDKRRVAHQVSIRVWESTDAMTADWAQLPWEVLRSMSRRITSDLGDSVVSVTYNITSKPPSTIEPQ